MKRNVLLAAALVSWVLVCCTIFSVKIEKLMTARVVTVSGTPFGRISMPLESAVRDETGWHLYSTYEGTGWESGTRVEERAGGSYTVYDDPEAVDEITGMKIPPRVEAAAPREGKLVRYFSRPLKAGEPAEVLVKRERGDDIWLVISKTSLPETLALPSTLELSARNDTSLLLTVPDEPQPFLESEARAQLANSKELAELITPLARNDLRIYSLADIEKFLHNLPRIAALFVMFLTPVALWVGICALSRRCGSTGLILTNLAMITLDGVSIPRLLDTIDLPSSLLPGDMIFDFVHYLSEFQKVFRALRCFESEEFVNHIYKTSNHTAIMSISILLIGVTLSFLIPMMEKILLCKKRNTVILLSGVDF